jgi:hypothetical protein
MILKVSCKKAILLKLSFLIIFHIFFTSADIAWGSGATALKPDKNEGFLPDQKRSFPSGKDWGFFISIYGWFPGLSGTVVTSGEAENIDIPFSDIAENIESGFMIYAEAHWQKWFLGFDGTWGTLAAEEKGNLIDLDITLRQRIYDIRLGREVYGRFLDGLTSAEGPAWRRRAVIEMFLGARYYSTKVDLNIRIPGGYELPVRGFEERWDPFIGLRARYDLTRRWQLSIRGDIGGFSIGNAARFTWQAEGLVGYRITDRFTVFAGLRVLAYDTREGEGAERGGGDLLQLGPLLGAGYSF